MDFDNGISYGFISPIIGATYNNVVAQCPFPVGKAVCGTFEL